MFWIRSKKKVVSKVLPAPYTIVEETDDFAYFKIEPGRPATIRDLQRMKDDGFKVVHAETKEIGGTIQSWIVCEKIKTP